MQKLDQMLEISKEKYALEILLSLMFLIQVTIKLSFFWRLKVGLFEEMYGGISGGTFRDV